MSTTTEYTGNRHKMFLQLHTTSFTKFWPKHTRNTQKFYAMGTRDSVLGNKAARLWGWQLTST